MAGFWGKKNLEKCSLCLIMFRSNWTEISWNVLIRPEAWLFGVNKRNNCQCSTQHPKHRVIREFGVLLAVWLFCPPAVHRQEALDRKCQLAPKTADGILEAGTTWKKCRILATYLSPIRMWRRRERRAVRLHGKRSDSWEKTVKSEGSFSQRRLMVKEVAHLR